MNESLSKLLSASINGYIDDSSEVERIVSNLVKLTPMELDPKKDCSILQNIEVYLDLIGQPQIDKEAVTYGEFMGIMESFGSDPKADDKEERNRCIKRSLCNLLCALRDNNGNNATIKLFNAITVGSFFECLSSRAGTGEDEFSDYFLNFRFHFQRTTGKAINKETTVSDFFRIISGELNKRWDILDSIEEYKENMEDTCELIYIFFIENFRMGFPEYFNRFHSDDTDNRKDEADECFTDEDLYNLDIEDFF